MTELALKIRKSLVLLCLVFLSNATALLLTGCEESKPASIKVEKTETIDVASHLVGSEETLLELTPTLRRLSHSVLNLQLPDERAKTVFSDQVALQGELAIAPNASSKTANRWIVSERPSDKAAQQLTKLNLWQTLFKQVEYFENAKFYFVQGELDQGKPGRFNSLVGFSGHAVYRDGRHASLKGNLNVTWQRDSSWKIVSWQLTDFSAQESDAKLFQSVFENAVADERVYRKVVKSYHSETTSKMLKGEDFFLPPGITYPFFFPDVTLEHPGVAVVDLNKDGFDDLYFSMQFGPNLFFENNGDGTFKELAGKYGLHAPGDSTSAIFADFDNDGDADVFIGRARQSALYLVNENGRFRNASNEKIKGRLPAMTSSISTADYNGDGLLDIYLCTYSPIEPVEVRTKKYPLWIERFLTREQAEKYIGLNKKSHRFLSRTGPPNLLLKNVGNGNFEVAPNNQQLELWRMSFQASWSDYDGDGDPDLYVANDYAPDTFFRNDGEDGFTDTTGELGFDGMGFGMGVSWGDYDNDGQTDLYVSNMFSKAGQRITSRVEGIDSRLKEMAAGNFLYRRCDEKFDLVSGLKDPKLQVAKAGWCWGGQFLDFDNDGFQDIYAVNGYYTAPDDVAVDVDL